LLATPTYTARHGTRLRLVKQKQQRRSIFAYNTKESLRQEETAANILLELELELELERTSAGNDRIPIAHSK